MINKAAPSFDVDSCQHADQIAEKGFWQPLLAFAVFAAVIISLGGIFFLQYRSSIKEEAQRHLAAISDLKIGQITNWMTERKGDAAVFQNSPTLLAEIERWQEHGALPGEAEQRLRARLGWLLKAYGQFGYSTVFLLDPRGKPVISAGESVPLQDFERQLAEKAMQRRETAFSDMQKSSARRQKNIEMALAAPLINHTARGERIIGSILLRIDPYRYLFPLIESWPDGSQSAETLLVRRDGDSVLFLNELRHSKNSALSLRLPLAAPNLPAAMAVRGKVGLVEGVDYRGVSTVGSLKAIAGTDWFMVSKIDRAELYAAVDHLLYWVEFLVLLLLSAALAAAIYWRRMQRLSFSMLQREYRNNMERGVLKNRLDYLAKYANDIIFLSAAGNRLLDANDRALQAYGYTADEFSQLSIPDLLAPEFKKLFPEGLQAVMHSGALRFESLHRRKDGTTFPVESSVREIEIDGQKCFQSIVRDISERKAVERKMQGLNRALRLLSDCNQALANATELDQLLTVICNLLMEKGGYLLAWVGFAENDEQKTVRVAAQASCDAGYLAKINVLWSDTERGRGTSGTAIRCKAVQISRDITGDPDMLPWRQAALKHGYRSCISLPLNDGDAAFGVMSIYSAEVGAFDAVDEVRLLTELADNLSLGIKALQASRERDLAAARLAASEQRFRRFFEETSDAMAYADAETGVFLNVNQSFADLLGYERAEMIGMPQKNLHPAPPEAVVSGSFEAHRGSGQGEVIETQAITRQGEFIDVAIKASVMELDGRQVVCGSFRDISAQKKAIDAEARLRRLLDNAPDMIYIFHPDSLLFTYGNRGAIEGIGYSLDELLQMTPMDLKPAFSESQFRQMVAPLIGGEKESLRFETGYRRKDGSEFPVEVNLQLVQEKEGEKQFVAVVRDISERKRLAAEMKRLSEAIEQSREAVVLSDSSGLFIYVNPAFTHMFGYTLEEAAGKPVQELIGASSSPMIQPVEAFNISSELGLFRQETERRTRDGRIIPVMLSVTCVRDSDGGTMGFIANVTDLSEAKRAEAELRRQKDFIRQVIDADPNRIFVKDSNGNFLLVNQSMAAAYNMTPDEMQGRNVRELNPHAEEVDGYQRTDREVIEQGREITLLETTSLPAGQPRWMLTTKKRLVMPDGTVNILGVAIDVHELKLAEDELRRQKDFIAQVIDTDPNLIFVKDEEGKFLLVNDSMATSYGLSVGEMIGRHNSDFVADREQAALYDQSHQKVMQSLQEVVGLEPATFADGSTHWLHTIRKPLLQDDGSVNVLSIAMDITERRDAEIKLAQSYRKLQQLTNNMEMLKEAEQANIARDLHDEIGALLAALNMSVSWFRKKIPADMSALQTEAEEMGKLVKSGFVTMRDLVARLRPSLLEDIGFIPAVEYYVKKFQRQSGIECKLVLPEEGLAFDPNRSSTLFRILQESLTNVAKHSQATELSINLRRQGATLVLSIKDNGVGFDRHAEGKNAFGILGIKERAMMVGGRAQIVSVLGEGTRVSVTIPGIVLV